LAKVEFPPLGRLLRKVKQLVVSHLPLLLTYFSLLRRIRVSCRAQGGRIRYGSLDITYTSAYISLDDDLVVDFTDDEADEIF